MFVADISLSESDWKEYMLDVSKDTMWEENLAFFLEKIEQEDIPSEIKEEILTVLQYS